VNVLVGRPSIAALLLNPKDSAFTIPPAETD
jgi:hypothetical protein